jgi:dTDP-4-amino-4,6-dideoxygalactose transaminase
MINEIGGEFWNCESVALEASGHGRLLPQMFDGLNERMYLSSGRGAAMTLLQILKPLQCSVLLPGYTCSSVIEPFVRAKYVINFYDIENDFSINMEKWWKQYTELKPGIVLLHSYFGFDTIGNLRDKYDEIRSHETIVIEDVTHSLLLQSQMQQPLPDYYIGSLRKWLGIPDGGFLISCRDDLPSLCLDTDVFFVEERKIALNLKKQYVNDADLQKKQESLKRFRIAENYLDKSNETFEISPISKAILLQTNWDFIRKRRRENYLFLEKYLTDFSSYLHPVFSALPNDVCPLFMPIWVKQNRQKLRDYLVHHDVYTPIHWPIPVILKKQYQMKYSDVYEHCLSIPCDQRYRPVDLVRVTELFRDYQKNNC